MGTATRPSDARPTTYSPRNATPGPHGANFQYHKGPNILVALILLLCLLIPGIIYILLAGKRESLVVNIDSPTAGMTVVQITSNGFRGKGAGRALRRQVSLPAGALGGAAVPVLMGGGGDA